MGTPAGTDAGIQSRDLSTPESGLHPAMAGAPTPDLADAPTPVLAEGSAAKVALVGVHGFGTHHLRNLERLQAAGVVDLVAVADPNPPASGSVPATTRVFPGLSELLAETTGLDLIIVATPIQTHAPLGLAALATAADLYLEKPPVASLADFNRLCDAAAISGRNVQIGFQSLGSHALLAIEKLLVDGTIGTLQGISATGPLGPGPGLLQEVPLGRQTHHRRCGRGGRRGHQSPGTCGGNSAADCRGTHHR
jgi:predicted dehydrogenase